jgi:hypothetical protein
LQKALWIGGWAVHFSLPFPILRSREEAEAEIVAGTTFSIVCLDRTWVSTEKLTFVPLKNFHFYLHWLNFTFDSIGSRRVKNVCYKYSKWVFFSSLE